MPNISKLAKGETATTNVAISGSKASVTFYVKPDKNSPDVFAINSVVDFGKCTPEDIARLAVRSVVIDLQRRFRSDIAGDKDAKAKAMNADTWATVDVKSSIIDAARRTSDPVAKATRAVAKLDPATRAALLAELTKTVATPKGKGK